MKTTIADIAPLTGNLDEVRVPPPPFELRDYQKKAVEMLSQGPVSLTMGMSIQRPLVALRMRLFPDGALVIDNPAEPLVVRPLAHIGAHEADPLTLALDEVTTPETLDTIRAWINALESRNANQSE